MAATSNTVGSWFNSGYYGHFRSKARNDFICEYRTLARPQPPEKFFNRSMQPIASHVFSKHDNRDALMSDAQYFAQGLGRRRCKDKRTLFNPDFYAWMPEREYLERSRPLVSTYKLDFNYLDAGCKPKQLLTERPKTSFDNSRLITSYMYAHGKAAPNLNQVNALNQRALLLTSHVQKERAASARPLRSSTTETVASCMNWYVPKPPVEAKSQAATQTQPPAPSQSSDPEPPPRCQTAFAGQAEASSE